MTDDRKTKTVSPLSADGTGKALELRQRAQAARAKAQRYAPGNELRDQLLDIVAAYEQLAASFEKIAAEADKWHQLSTTLRRAAYAAPGPVRPSKTEQIE
jgi:hypothetical protein